MDGAEERLAAIYRRAGREVRGLLLGQPGATFSDPGGEARIRRVRAVVSALDLAAVRWIDREADLRYARAAAQSRTILQVLGRRPGAQPTADRRSSVKDAASRAVLKANASIVEVARRYVALQALASAQAAQVREFSFAQGSDDITRMARDVVRTEGTRKELAGKVRDYLGRQIGEDQFIEIVGKDGVARLYSVEKYSMMVARTTLRQAQTGATLDLCERYDNDLVEWSDHDTKCEECEVYEGQIYSISGTDPVYPPLEEVPPIHPNCEHSILPTSQEAIATRRAGFLPPHVPRPEPPPEPEPGPAPAPRPKPRTTRRRPPKPVVAAPKAPATPQPAAEASAYDRWTPAASLREAEQWARDNIMLERTATVTYRGLSLEAANAMNRELSYLTRSGYKLAQISPGRSGRAIMWVNQGSVSVEKIGPQGLPYWGRNKGIEFHYNAKYFKTTKETEGICRAMHQSGWQLNQDMSSLIQHELGHALDGSWMFTQKGYWTWGSEGTRSRWLYDHWKSQFASASEMLEAKDWVKTNYSGAYMWVKNKGTLAAQNVDEFFAEAYRLYRQGRLPSSMEDFADIFKGWGW